MNLETSLRVLKHRWLLVINKLKGSSNYEDAIAEAMAGIAARWHGEIDPFFSYIAMMDVLKQADIEGRGLEIGGGYSTVLLCQLIDRNGMKIESIDMNPEKYLRIIPGRKTRRYVFDRITRVDKLSVSLDEVVNSFKLELPFRISQFGSDLFLQTLMSFVNESESSENPLTILDGGVEKLGERLLELPYFKKEKSFYYENDLVNGQGYCSELVECGREFSFIFFDCGEYSSLAEWFILESQVEAGGFALLHDIYFPKSVKNFLVATLIQLSEKWEIVYVDRKSPQGCLVAKKLYK